MNSGIKALKRVGKILAAYRTGLLNYFDHRITSGAVEGLVNKIKTLKRQAYGFRDLEYFKLRLYHLHTQRYAFAGRPHFFPGGGSEVQEYYINLDVVTWYLFFISFCLDGSRFRILGEPVHAVAPKNSVHPACGEISLILTIE